MTAGLLIAAVLLLGAAVALSWFVYPFRVFLLFGLGRSWCPLAEAWSAARRGSMRRRLRDRLRRSARIARRDGEAVLWEIDGESHWLPRASEILPGMLADQRMGIYEAAGHGVRPGDVVLDCGASIGLYTLHALALGARHVVAIEPSPRNLECLRRNLAEPIASGRVTLVEKGVWDGDGELRLRMQEWNSAADTVALDYRGSRSGPTVPVTTIDALVRELGLGRVDYIKIDTEGAEAAALRGAAETLRRFHPRLTIATEHRFDDPREIPKVVRSIASDYQSHSGPCIDSGNALRPATIDFYWPAGDVHQAK